MCNSNNNSEKESARLLLSGDITGGCFKDDASAALGIELVSHADGGSFVDASSDNLTQDVQFGKECGIVQGRVAREPVDRARYVIVDGSNGTMFACSRCSKQYIHRKSLNKHWSDKHADDTIDRGKYLPYGICSVSEPHLALVHCLSNSTHVALSCSTSLARSTVHSHTVCLPTYSVASVAGSWQKTHDNVPQNRTKFTGTIGHSALWHSLAAIHCNEEPDLNSFCYAPMPAHAGGYNSGRASLLNQIFCDDDCQVLDLSVGSSAVHELSHSPAPDVPIDLSLKSKNVRLAESEKEALPLHGKTVSKSAVRCDKEMSAADALVLNKSESAGNWVDMFCGSTKNRKCVQSDSVAALRRLHSGILTNAASKSELAYCNSRSAVDDVSSELKSCQTKVEPTVKYLRLPNLVHVKSILKMPFQKPDDLATPEETHEYFGGMSRGGHIRCKKCDFSATSMLLFSQHVAWHARKPDILSGICDGVQNECGDGKDDLEGRFFTWLGLQRADSVDVDSDKKSGGRSYCAADDSLDKDEYSDSTCKEVFTGTSDFTMQEVQTNGFGNHFVEESGPQKNFNSDSVQQKMGGSYRRGLGLTTTESRDAVGRSWRRRRLRTCERCGYVTDNVTTLKRHEVKHGALGMYRCKLCDYTVNQQHILEYHTRNVHGLSSQTGPPQLNLFRITDTPLDSAFSKHFDRTAASFIGDGHEARSSKDLLETVSPGDSAIQRGCGVFTCNSEGAKLHGIQRPVSACNMLKVIRKNTFASVTVAQHHLLNAFGLQVGRGICVRCGFRSLNAVKMKRHMLQHPHDQHTCSQCSHTSPTARLLLKHIRQQHVDCGTGHFTQKVYQCPECPFLAASPNRLQCHTQFHGAKLRHVCGECSYSVDRVNLIAQHRRLHVSAFIAVQKRRWLHCSNCPFRTTNKGGLVNHERGHSAINSRYMCSLCSFGTGVANVAFGHQQLHSRVK